MADGYRGIRRDVFPNPHNHERPGLPYELTVKDFVPIGIAINILEGKGERMINFIMGAVCGFVLLLVGLILIPDNKKKKEFNQKLVEYWDTSIRQQQIQLEILEQIQVAIEQNRG